jgi:two-component system, chemotaxis family, response regulator Rcp1
MPTDNGALKNVDRAPSGERRAQGAEGRLKMLLVEDNLADIVFFQEAVEATGTSAAIHVVHDGQAAMQFLRRQPPYAGAPRPDVVVLDLNLPLKSGHDVVTEMEADSGLRTIPVAVLTTSTSEVHVCRGYPTGRCLYFVKTDEFRRLQDIVREIARHAGAVQP